MTTEEAPGPAGDRPGVFSSEMLRDAVAAGHVTVPGDRPVADGQYQPASLDLRLGAKAHRLRSSFLPGAGATVRERLKELELGRPLPLSRGAVLERGRPYLIPLVEGLRLPADVRGRANPRSSTGRLDIFTRVITDYGVRFDEVPEGYDGPLWLEVYSNTFTISVAEGLCLAQLRLSNSRETLRGEDIRALHKDYSLLFAESVGKKMGGREAIEELPLAGGTSRGAVVDQPLIASDGLFIGVNLPAGQPMGWRAKGNSGLLDLTRESHYEVLEYWEPVIPERGGRLVLQPEEFYLLISREFIRIPGHVAAEMVAYDPTNGELRTHYAGFFDPGFGYGRDGLRGTRAVLEVRAHDVPFMLEHGQPVARFAFERMAREPLRQYGDAGASSHFQEQGVALSRQFRRVAGTFSMPVST